MPSHRSWLVIALPLLIAGCPGELEDRKRFTAPSTSQDASMGADGPSCEIDVEQMLADTCGTAGCHDDSAEAAAGLDLVSPGYADRLVGVPAAKCEGRTRVDPADVGGSYFMEKLEDSPECGEKMPLVGMELSDQEKTCLQQWLQQLATDGGGGGSSDTEADGGSAPSSDAGTSSSGGTDVETLLAGTCGGGACHDATAPKGGLDLVSSGYSDRLIGVSSETCDGRTLVDPANVAGSFFMEKLSDAPECGVRMPKGGMELSSEQKADIQKWLEGLADGGGA